MISLIDVVVALEGALGGGRAPHAFGGAIALGYFIDEPRGTRDVDLNIFLPLSRMGDALEALPPEVTYTDDDLELLGRDGQARLRWFEDGEEEAVPVDVFLSTHEFHRDAALHVITVPFAGIEIPVLDSTALTVFKAFFNRTKDWGDVEAMAVCGSIDRERVIGWMDRLLGADDKRTRRLAETLERFSQSGTGGPADFNPPTGWLGS